jgi:carboxymethylenebutenolidase
MGGFQTLVVNGTSVRMYVAGDVTPGTPGIALLHAWWGLNDDVVAFAERLAAAGFAVAAPDMFNAEIATTVQEAERLSGSSDDDALGAIVLGTVDWLAERLGSTSTVSALGFSFGAAWAIWAPTKSTRIAATLVYYGTWTGSILSQSHVPALGHFAENDPYETAETVDAFEKGLLDAGRTATIYRYPGTGHWFAEPSQSAYRAEAADLAFQRTVDFLKNRIAAPAG